MKVRCRDSSERPTVDVRGFGHGIRAVTLPTEPSCSCTGKSAMSALMACISLVHSIYRAQKAYPIVQLYISYLYKPRAYLGVNLLDIELPGLQKVTQSLSEREGDESLLDTGGKRKVDGWKRRQP